MKKETKVKRAVSLYKQATIETKELLNYFIQSLKRNSYILPEHLYYDRDPDGFIVNVEDARWLTSKIEIEVLKRAVDVCHNRSHNFWGTKCPVLKIITLRKAYNSLLSEGLLVQKEAGEYGKSIKKF